jgi:hypothetical protein
MRPRTVIILSVFATLAAIIIVSMLYPPADDLYVENPEWNGLSKMYRLIEPIRVADFKELTSIDSGSTLFIIGPERDYTEDEANAAVDYLSRGGRIVVMDDFGSANTLLVRLELDTVFSGELLADPLFKTKNHLLPRIRTVESSFGEILDIEMNYPTTIIVSEGMNIIAKSSRFSYLADDLDDDGTDTPSGAYPVITSVNYGVGEVVLVSDSSVFINGMIERADNKKLLEELASDMVFIDESHFHPTRLTIFNRLFRRMYWMLGRVEFRYSLLLMFGILLFKVDWTEKQIKEGRQDELEAVLKDHPEADRKILEKLEESRREKIGPERRPRKD